MRTIRVGLGSWPSAAPYTWPLRSGMIAWPHSELIVDDAAALDERMALKTLTIALVSPEAYLWHQADWVASPAHALTAARPGASAALLVSRHDLALLDGTEMAVPPASGSEPTLLAALLRDRYDLVVTTVPRRGPIDKLLQEFPAALLVGERALLTAQRLPEGVRAYDLGDVWRDLTGLPYPVGLWAAQRTWASDHADAWMDAQRLIGQARDLSLLMIDPLIEEQRRRLPLSDQTLRTHLAAYDYQVRPALTAALQRFAQLAGLPAPREPFQTDR